MTAAPSPRATARPKTHVFFDFFGTLVDYDPSVHPASRNAPHEFAVRAGAPIDAPAASRLWERAWLEVDGQAASTGRECSMREIAERFSELAGIAAPDAELECLVDDYLEAWTSGITLASGAEACLAALAPLHTLAVVSNAHDPRLVPRMLRRFKIEHFFTDVITSVELGWRKPHPEIYRIALERTAGSVDATVFVGDTWEADVAGPRALGMDAIYVGFPRRDRAAVGLAEVASLLGVG
ncbi:putative hydrolase of the HAD superfamily [Leucobacter komagatae]|uniref:Putative hydrolase of the HAD superfamily n=1 Tax=Leucobacter komagatae TaxID=55969 RepID=A0A542Y400_9MICO|nr:HAD family hydrolase [Leucobacter komagatae]TQL42807.1 putative hydrolase of the HAD superfamily [Leucobacter komagatae]